MTGGAERGHTATRVCRHAFNPASMSLSASLGFEVNEPLALMQGKLTAGPSAGAVVRPMRETDLPACGDLCRRAHGFDRNPELADAIKMLKPFVVERRGQVTAYLSSPNFYVLNHAVAETGQDMRD